MVNQLEYGKLKYELKDLLFIAFQQRKPEPFRTLHSLVKVDKVYPLTVKSYWVLVYSALLLNPVLGMSFED